MRLSLLLIVLCSCGSDPDIGTVCRAADAANPCDVDDVWIVDEQTRTKTCPATGGNQGTLCRASAGACDPQEECDGKSEACPIDSLFNSTVVCSGGSRCMSTSRCTGTAPGCPAQTTFSAGTPCRDVDPARMDCDLADVCDAAGNCSDQVQPVGKVCMANLCSGPFMCPQNMNRCCPKVGGTCSASGTCAGASCNCFCTNMAC